MFSFLKQKSYSIAYRFFDLLIEFPLLCISFFVVAFYRGRKRNKWIFGTTPIISKKYWSQSLKELGYESITICRGVYGINKKTDFDLYFEDFNLSFFKYQKLVDYRVLWFSLANANIICTDFDGFALGYHYFWKMEPILLKLANVKLVCIPYGSDAYVYESIPNLSLKHVLMSDYPHSARKEQVIKERVKIWSTFANVIGAGIQTEGMIIWNLAPAQYVTIDTNKQTIRKFQGKKNDCIRIVHAPNHRSIKGTVFVKEVVKELKADGMNIELFLLEKISNDKVLEILGKADILIEQLIIPFYALNGIEGMLSGIPVLTNMESETYRNLFKRFSYLNECPIVSTTPENIKENLRVLIENPDLREELGKAGREYVEKYHSYKTSQYLFGSIYDKIIDGKDVDLMNLFHPILSEYNKSMPFVRHPLINGQIPQKYFKDKQ